MPIHPLNRLVCANVFDILVPLSQASQSKHLAPKFQMMYQKMNMVQYIGKSMANADIMAIVFGIWKMRELTSENIAGTKLSGD